MIKDLRRVFSEEEFFVEPYSVFFTSPNMGLMSLRGSLMRNKRKAMINPGAQPMTKANLQLSNPPMLGK